MAELANQLKVRADEADFTPSEYAVRVLTNFVNGKSDRKLLSVREVIRRIFSLFLPERD
jgi:hypothetical protein